MNKCFGNYTFKIFVFITLSLTFVRFEFNAFKCDYIGPLRMKNKGLN